MKDLKLVVAYALFGMFLLGVCVWGITQDYKYGGNPEVVRIEHDIDTIVVYENGRDYDWEIFTQALIWVESKGDSKAVGSKDDTGVLQITPILLQDCNRILKTERFTLEDRLDSLKSVEMFNIIQEHYNPQRDFHLALKIWNCHAPLSYHRKVMDKFNEIKYGRNRQDLHKELGGISIPCEMVQRKVFHPKEWRCHSTK
jgi:hypothetical protein